MFPTLTTRPDVRVPADARLDNLLAAYVDAYADYIRKHNLPTNLCIHASRITEAVLANLGINGAVPVGVDLIAAPPHAAGPLARGTADQDLPDTYAVGIVGTDEVIENAWCGHVLTYVQALQGRRQARLVDPTASQFSAPALGIELAGYVVDASDAFLKSRPLVTSTGGAALWIRRNARLNGFRDHCDDQAFIDEATAELSAAVAHATRHQTHDAA